MMTVEAEDAEEAAEVAVVAPVATMNSFGSTELTRRITPSRSPTRR